MLTAQEIYTSTVRGLPAAERLRLAALILNDMADSETHTQQTVEMPGGNHISESEFKAAVDMLFERYSHTLQRLAE